MNALKTIIQVSPDVPRLLRDTLSPSPLISVLQTYMRGNELTIGADLQMHSDVYVPREGTHTTGDALGLIVLFFFPPSVCRFALVRAIASKPGLVELLGPLPGLRDSILSLLESQV